MPVVVVGGHTRNIGKTTLVTQLLSATAELGWTAIKITQYGHNICSANGEACDCAAGDHAVAVSEERRSDSGTDTGRMLAAGAERVLWIRTQQGALKDAMPRLRRELAGAPYALVESNSVLRFLRPDIYLSVLHPRIADFKPSSLRYLDRAHALFVPEGECLDTVAWPGVSAAMLRQKPVYSLNEDRLPDEAVKWFRAKLAASTHPAK